MKLKYVLFLFILLGILPACKETTPTDPNQALLANKDWNTDGVYINVSATPTKVIAPNVKLRFKNTSALRSIALNGTDLAVAATWTLSADGKSLTVNYPKIGVSGNPIESKVLKVAKLTETELWLTTEEADGISLFGVITITPNSQFRLTTGASQGNVFTNATLTTPTWQASGLYKKSDGTLLSSLTTTFKFKTQFGINYVEIGGVPTPVTWTINADTAPTQLTLGFPKTVATAAGYKTLAIDKLDATNLWLSASEDFNFYNIINFTATNQLRMAPQP